MTAGTKLTSCVIGAGSFGTAIARIVADNVAPGNVRLWARRPDFAKALTSTRFNEQYLPGARLPDNMTVSSDLQTVATGAEVVVLGVPHTYVTPTMLKDIASVCADRVHVVSLAKGIEFRDGQLKRISQIIQEGFQSEARPDQQFEVSALMGANVYDQMGRDEFAEATLGCASGDPKLLEVFNDPTRFSVTMTKDLAGVEFCGGLKNVVALAAGYCEGLELGSNTKAAIIRRGLLEIMALSRKLDNNVTDATFFESAGIADLMTTCFGGRGRRLAAAFVREKQLKGWAELERELLNGQQLPDWHNAQHVYHFLNANSLLEEFPLFTAVYKIGFEMAPPTMIVEALYQR